MKQEKISKILKEMRREWLLHFTDVGKYLVNDCFIFIKELVSIILLFGYKL